MEPYNFFFYLIFSLFLVLTILFIIFRLSKFLDRRKFGNAVSKSIFTDKSVKIKEKIQKNKYLKELHLSIALRLSLLNARSMEENEFFAVWILISGSAFFVMISIFFLFFCFPLWYISLIYILLTIGGFVLSFVILSSLTANRFLKQMPQMLKYISSRYMGRKNIVKALGDSVNDLSGRLGGEVIRILDVLKQNNMKTARHTFQTIEQKYNSEYMAVFLDLIWNAHYYGGSEEIEKQFEEMIHDILETMENRRDLASAARSYIAMSLLFLPALPGIKLFNSMLDNSASYYGSLEGIFLLILFLTAVLLFCALMIYLERSGS